jgi:hypothetical protein
LRIAPLWRLLDGVAEDDWAGAVDMDGVQVTVARYCPDWWPAATRLPIRRVRLDIDAGQVSADPRARRRRTLRPEQRVLPIAELTELNAVYGFADAHEGETGADDQGGHGHLAVTECFDAPGPRPVHRRRSLRASTSRSCHCRGTSPGSRGRSATTHHR